MPDGENISNDPVIRARMVALEKHEREQAERLEQQARHIAQEEERAARKTAELAELLSMVKEPEQRIIRLEAFKLVMGAHSLNSVNGAQKQLMLDDKALELARYAILGEV